MIIKKHLIPVLFLILILGQACKKDKDENPTPDINYPFTFYSLNETEWNNKLEQFNFDNQHENLTINQFGFVQGKISVDYEDEIDKDFVIKNISDFISHYKNYLGIEKPEEILFDEQIFIRLSSGYYASLNDYFEHELRSNKLEFYLEQINLDNKRILDSPIIFYFNMEESVLEISGNWFPEAFIPENEIISAKKAFEITVSYIDENYNELMPLNISINDSENFNKILVPLRFEEKIELRECWEINSRLDYILVCIDTQTGELIKFLNYNYGV